jgi:hypothetical protein
VLSQTRAAEELIGRTRAPEELIGPPPGRKKLIGPLNAPEELIDHKDVRRQTRKERLRKEMREENGLPILSAAERGGFGEAETVEQMN